MSRYTPLEGIVTSITPMQTGDTTYDPCTLFLTLQGAEQQEFHVILNPSTFVLDQMPIQHRDSIIIFYDNMAPMPMIYPPQYQAIAVLHPKTGQSAVLDYFDQNLVNSDNTLRLNLSGETSMRLPNGQYYLGTPGNQFLLVLYSNTTRSIPAQTTPDEITVFCRSST